MLEDYLYTIKDLRADVEYNIRWHMRLFFLKLRIRNYFIETGLACKIFGHKQKFFQDRHFNRDGIYMCTRCGAAGR